MNLANANAATRNVTRDMLSASQRAVADAIAHEMRRCDNGEHVVGANGSMTAEIFASISIAVTPRAQRIRPDGGEHFFFAAWSIWCGWIGFDHEDASQPEWQVGRWARILYDKRRADDAAMSEVVL